MIGSLVQTFKINWYYYVEAICVSIDFEKCFDTIEMNTLGALHFFNFGEYFIKLVKLLYDFIVCTSNNGYISKWFEIQRWVWTSRVSYLRRTFSVMCRSSVNTRIKGVNIEGIIETKTQYTDDTGLFLEYDAESLQAAINIFQLFECNTGLKTNYERQLYIHSLGPLVGKNIKLKTSKNVLKKLQKLNTSKNSSGPIKMLRL